MTPSSCRPGCPGPADEGRCRLSSATPPPTRAYHRPRARLGLTVRGSPRHRVNDRRPRRRPPGCLDDIVQPSVDGLAGVLGEVDDSRNLALRRRRRGRSSTRSRRAGSARCPSRTPTSLPFETCCRLRRLVPHRPQRVAQRFHQPRDPAASARRPMRPAPTFALRCSRSTNTCPTVQAWSR